MRHSLTCISMPEPATFSVKEASAEDYIHLISTIRAACLGVRSREYGTAGQTWNPVRYLPTRLRAGELFTEFFVRGSDLRIVGFRNTREDWQAPPESPYRYLQGSVVPGEMRRTTLLPFREDHASLERAAGVHRLSLVLGRRPLARAILDIHRNVGKAQTARGLLVITQMLCEAARFTVIAEEIARSWLIGGRSAQSLVFPELQLQR